MTRLEYQEQVREAGRRCKGDPQRLLFELLSYIRDKQAAKQLERANQSHSKALNNEG